MTVSEALASVEFIVGRDGKPRAAVLDIAAWEALIAWLEDAEDLGLAMDYLARRRRWGWCRGRKWRQNWTHWRHRRGKPAMRAWTEPSAREEIKRLPYDYEDLKELLAEIG